MSQKRDLHEVERNGDRVSHVVLYGEHDLSNVEELKRVLAAEGEAGRGVVLDLTEVEFIDSSVLHAILGFSVAQRRAGRSLAVRVGSTSTVHRVLQISGVLDAIPSAETPEGAIEIARGV